MHNQVVLAVNQIETHPFHQQIELVVFWRNGVQIESWGPFAEGKNNIFSNELLLSIAAKYHKSVAQVILRWLTQRGVVVIPSPCARSGSPKTSTFSISTLAAKTWRRSK